MRSGVLGPRLSEIVVLEGLAAADVDIPEYDVVCCVRNLVKARETKMADQLHAERVKRHRELVYGAWLRRDNDHWK